MGKDSQVTTGRQMLGAELLCPPQIHIGGWDWDVGSLEGDQDSGRGSHAWISALRIGGRTLSHPFCPARSQLESSIRKPGRGPSPGTNAASFPPTDP